jgi:predicted SprT family Zn-dependent metalloprotease
MPSAYELVMSQTGSHIFKLTAAFFYYHHSFDLDSVRLEDLKIFNFLPEVVVQHEYVAVKALRVYVHSRQISKKGGDWKEVKWRIAGWESVQCH